MHNCFVFFLWKQAQTARNSEEYRHLKQVVFPIFYIRSSQYCFSFQQIVECFCFFFRGKKIIFLMLTMAVITLQVKGSKVIFPNKEQKKKLHSSPFPLQKIVTYYSFQFQVVLHCFRNRYTWDTCPNPRCGQCAPRIILLLKSFFCQRKNYPRQMLL